MILSLGDFFLLSVGMIEGLFVFTEVKKKNRGVSRKFTVPIQTPLFDLSPLICDWSCVSVYFK